MKNLEDNTDPVAQLLRKAGKRPAPPPEMVERVRAKVHAEWQQEVSKRRQRRFIAVAASLLAAVGAGWLVLQLDSAQPSDFVAHVQGGTRVFAMGERVQTGAGEGLVLVASPSVGGAGVSVRLAPDTTIAWTAPQRLQLLRGQAYVDSDTAPADNRMLIVDAGKVRIEHVGTRYIASLNGAALEITVRDGTVRLQVGEHEALLYQGEQGHLDSSSPDVAQMVRTPTATSGSSWDWVDAMAPRIAIENVDLHTVLVRLAHEAGLTVEYASPSVETSAHATILHGPVLDLPPMQGLQAVLATTSFVAEPEQDGTVFVRSR